MMGHRLIERLRAWSALLPLVALLAGTYWLSQQVLPLPPTPDYRARHDPDYIINNFSAVTFGAQGAPRFLLAAQKMEHYPDDDTTHLEEPRLTSPYVGKPPIHISAKRGEISHNGDEIFLRDEVKIVREASPRQGELVITTSYLHAVPEEEKADTDRAITLTDARGAVNAVGMKLDSKAREIKLLAQVRSQYEPAKN